MHPRTPETSDQSAAHTTVTSFCLATAWACELCGGRQAQVVIRLTSHGPACLDLCPSCRQLPAPIVLRTPTAANEHREHLTRARDRGELP